MFYTVQSEDAHRYAISQLQLKVKIEELPKSLVNSYFACLLVSFIVSNKRPNGWFDPAQFFCGTSNDQLGKVYGW